jgi:hypothetical protein
MKLLSLVPNSLIHVYVSGLYIPRIGLPLWLQQNRQTDPGLGVYKSLPDMNVETGRKTLLFCFRNNEAVQFRFRENLNHNQTFTYIGYSLTLHLQCKNFPVDFKTIVNKKV